MFLFVAVCWFRLTFSCSNSYYERLKQFQWSTTIRASFEQSIQHSNKQKGNKKTNSNQIEITQQQGQRTRQRDKQIKNTKLTKQQTKMSKRKQYHRGITHVGSFKKHFKSLV
jgi:hypothetical protein